MKKNKFYTSGKDNNPLIYKATNLLNSKCYIGKSVKGLSRRIKGHIRSTQRGSDSHFHNAIRKDGIENFHWEILYEESRKICSLYDLETKEKEFIKKYKSNFRKYGYNMTPGGEGGDVLSRHPNKLAILKKLSDALKNKRKTTYKLVSPNGEEIIVLGLGDICKQYGLKRSHLIAIAKNKLLNINGRKHHKEWTCEFITKPQFLKHENKTFLKAEL